MSSSVTAVWAEAVVQAPYGLIKGESVRSAAFDLRTKQGAQLFIGVGFGGSTDLTNGVDVKLYRVMNNDATGQIQYGQPWWAARTTIDPGTALINNGANYAIGASSIAYDGAAGRAFAAGDLLCFWGETSIPTSSGLIATPTVEYVVAGKAAATPFLLDQPTKIAHLDNEFVTNANGWNVWLPGGSSYVLVFDYLDDAAGEAVCCAASMQTYDSDSIA